MIQTPFLVSTLKLPYSSLPPALGERRQDTTIEKSKKLKGSGGESSSQRKPAPPLFTSQTLVKASQSPVEVPTFLLPKARSIVSSRVYVVCRVRDVVRVVTKTSSIALLRPIPTHSIHPSSRKGRKHPSKGPGISVIPTPCEKPAGQSSILVSSINRMSSIGRHWCRKVLCRKSKGWWESYVVTRSVLLVRVVCRKSR